MIKNPVTKEDATKDELKSMEKFGVIVRENNARGFEQTVFGELFSLFPFINSCFIFSCILLLGNHILFRSIWT